MAIYFRERGGRGPWSGARASGAEKEAQGAPTPRSLVAKGSRVAAFEAPRRSNSKSKGLSNSLGEGQCLIALMRGGLSRSPFREKRRKTRRKLIRSHMQSAY